MDVRQSSMEEMVNTTMGDLNYFKGKKVFVTGHTGFKGSWLCRILLNSGAEITGYSLQASTEPSLFSMSDIEQNINSIIGDIRDLEHLKRTFNVARPEIVLHLAAQPLVRESYQHPVYTYETNVMGTVNILECVRTSSHVRSVLNITTDKVYENREWYWGYRETEPLDGFDPYSNSKSCSELVTHSYKNSFFQDNFVAVSTARAGNVIGGGDFAADRIIPDCIRAVQNNTKIIVRNPYSTRPYQHVLEPLFAYLMIAQRQNEDHQYSGWYNVGPDDSDCVTTGELVELFCTTWGEEIDWENQPVEGPHEAGYLKLDCSKIKNTFHWSPVWSIKEAIEATCDWTRVWLAGGNIPEEMDRQILHYRGDFE